MTARPFHANLRSAVLRDCEKTALDVAIVGGGITGAGCLRDATLRGLRAALFERNDFASGTSGKSSKLIHGGLRYLETGDLRLVFEAARERKILLDTAPKIVRPQPFLYPVYKNHRRGFPAVVAGVTLYNLLSLFRNIGRPRFQGKNKTLSMEPLLRKDGLTGSALYYDAATQDTALTLSTVRSAWKKGGLAVNHAEVSGLLEEGGRVAGVNVKDRLDGKTYAVRAKWVINATGPWSDRFLSQTAGRESPRLRLTKGTHIVIGGERLPLRQAVLMLAPSDGRVTFAIPWENAALIGTTDTDFTGDPSSVSADTADIAYLLDTANHYFPSAALTRTDVISAFAGLRPLLRDDSRSPSGVSREHRIFIERDGLLTLAGGKLTTYRKMAEEAVDRLIALTPGWKKTCTPCETAVRPLEVQAGLSTDLGYSIEQEMAATVEDLLSRRTLPLWLDRSHGVGLAEKAADLLRKKLGWSEQEIARQLDHYAALVQNASEGR